MNEKHENPEYSSWIAKAEDAEDAIQALSQYMPRILICNKNDVRANSVIIFDTSTFSK